MTRRLSRADTPCFCISHLTLISVSAYFSVSALSAGRTSNLLFYACISPFFLPILRINEHVLCWTHHDPSRDRPRTPTVSGHQRDLALAVAGDMQCISPLTETGYGACVHRASDSLFRPTLDLVESPAPSAISSPELRLLLLPSFPLLRASLVASFAAIMPLLGLGAITGTVGGLVSGVESALTPVISTVEGLAGGIVRRDRCH